MEDHGCDSACCSSYRLADLPLPLFGDEEKDCAGDCFMLDSGAWDEVGKQRTA